MPEIVRFYGIIIKMFFKPKEHEPSHIHAIYNEYVGLFNIKTYEMFEGVFLLKHKSWLRNGCRCTAMNFKRCGTNKS